MIRAALRPLVRRPGPSALIIVTLAAAIGTATVTYSIVDMLRHAVPISRPGRFAFIASTDPRSSQAQAGVAGGLARTGVSIPDLTDFEARAHAFEQFTAFTFSTATWTSTGTPERLRVLLVSTNLLPAWGLSPATGRGFVAADGQTNAPPVMLGFQFWTRRFAASPRVLGRSIVIDGQPRTVVGVLPRALDDGIFGGTDIATPIVMDPLRAARDERRLFVFGVMGAGVTLEQARADLDRIARQLQREHPQTNASTGVVVRPPLEQLGATIPVLIVFLLLIAAALMALACANVTNIVLAVGASRRHEFAIRRSLGASPRSQLVQLLLESLLLSAVSCLVGVLLAWGGLKGLGALDPGRSSPLASVTLNPRVLLAAMAMATASALGFGLLPAWRTARAPAPDLLSNTRNATSAPERLFVAHALVAAQVAIAVVLLVQVASFTRAAWRIVGTARGFDERGLLTFKADLPAARYADRDAIGRFTTQLLSSVASTSGVVSAAAINRMPIADREMGAHMVLEGTRPRPQDAPPVTLAGVTADYLATLRIPLVRGRNLRSDDVLSRHAVALVSEAAARRYWPGRDPVGTHVTIDMMSDVPLEIVGVAGDIRNSDADQGPPLQVYVPFTLTPSRTIAVLVRTASASPAALAPAIRRAAARVDNSVPLFDVAPMTTVLFEDTAGSVLVATVLAAIGFVALLLAIAGVYGLVSYAVSQRTREIGVRLALGARPGIVARMVILQGSRPVVVGALLGATGASALALIATSAITDVNFLDPVNYAIITSTLVAIALASSLVPASRAARIDPVAALRAE
ncbi:MAG TPA: ADOP family duplicated permease [Vicinamibacterales bacterium]|nr:ADOP family duplicated permease [Vicinamibacterales bacterium]